MSQISYIRAAGDPDYNFAYSDFTVEFFVESSDSDGVQTLFEIANNESAAANLYTQTRFFTAIENGNLNAYAIQTTTPFMVGAGVTVFTSPVPVGPNDRIFYDGQFLTTGDYTISGTTITLDIPPNTLNNVLVEIGQVLFQVQGQEFSSGNVHYVSAERFQNQFYLFLDGKSQSTPVPAFNAIPTQVISNTVGNGNLARFDSPALLTIGANKNGKDAVFGKFGDFKITNGVSRHVQASQIQQTISSQFTDANLGMQLSSIEIEGGGFVDTDSSYTPEELVPGQIFDTLYMQVYQSSTSNANANILSFAMFKPTIMAGPIGSYSFTMPTDGSEVTLPWTVLDAAAASVLVNGNAIPSTSWTVFDSVLTIIAGPGDAVDIISTGPTNYYDVSSNSVSTITSNVYANSTSIQVADTTPFITPIIGSTSNVSNTALLNVRGQVFVNQECITYLYIDRVTNTLSGLMRGTSGTGVPLVHLANSRIVSACYDRDLQGLAVTDPRTAIWYAIPLANTSLQNTSTAISTVLVNSGGLPPVTPF
jgi:hypothetical protein